MATNHAVVFDEDTMKQLENESIKLDCSVSHIANQAVKRYLAQQSYERLAIREALKEAEKGIFVSSEAMGAWFSSLGTDNELPRPKPDIFLKQ